MSNSGKANTMGLLQLLVLSYVLHNASGLDCYLCASGPGGVETCNCKKSPEKGCDGLPPEAYTRGSLKALQSQLKVVTGNKTNDAKYGGGAKVCVILVGSYGGQESFVRTRLSKYNDLVSYGVTVSANCKLQTLNIVTTDENGIKGEIREACMCNTDYCNGVSSPHEEFPWSRTALLTLIALSISSLATSKFH